MPYTYTVNLFVFNMMPTGDRSVLRLSIELMATRKQYVLHLSIVPTGDRSVFEDFQYDAYRESS